MKKNKKYTAEENKFIIENYNKLSFLEIAKKLNKTSDSIKKQAKLLGVYNFTDIDYMFTNREIDILELMSKGYSNNEIAESLVIAVTTVKTHLTSIYNKLTIVKEDNDNSNSVCRVKVVLAYLKMKGNLK